MVRHTHVFLSFRGEIRQNFTLFLYEALKDKGYIAFMDTSNIGVGDEVDSTIKEGIRDSKSAIIIFSQNYAYSTWCLDELVLILEQKKKDSSFFIIPIFYDVKTQDIKHQLGNYGKALEKHRKRHGDRRVDKWRKALVEVGNIFGKHVEAVERVFPLYVISTEHKNFIRTVVELFGEKIADKSPDVPMFLSLKRKIPPIREPPPKDKVILYTTFACNHRQRTKRVKELLATGNFVFEERNCSKEPKYILDLLDYDKVRFPMLIVYGKDFCGEEQVEGLDDFESKRQVMLLLKSIYWDEIVENSLDECFDETAKFLRRRVDKVMDFFSS